MAINAPAPLRLALVGVGQIVQNYHVPALNGLGHRIVYAADPSERSLDNLRALVPLPFTGEATAEPEIPSGIDAVLVASPSALHAAQVRRFLAAGHPVFCEKPLACRAAEAEALVALAQSKGLVLQTGFYRRHFPSLRQLGAWLRFDLYGPPGRIAIRAGHIAQGIPESFLSPALAGGGVLMDFGVHAFDLLAGWCDELQLDDYADDAQAGGIEANACARLTGRIAGRQLPILIELSRTSPLGYFARVNFDRATVQADLNAGHELSVRSNAMPNGQLRLAAGEPRDTVHYFAEEWREFSRRLGGEPEKTHSMRDAVRATELAEACYSRRRSLVLPWGD